MKNIYLLALGITSRYLILKCLVGYSYLLQIKAEEVKAIADEAKADLALAMPAMEAAQNALKALNKADINELKAFQKPPALVRFVMEPICILFNAK